jgi:hypothetical protein
MARITLPARISARATRRTWVTTEARATAEAGVTAVEAVRAARLHGTALPRTLPHGPLIHGPLIYRPLIHRLPICGLPICGPPVCGTVPPVLTRVPVALTTVVAIGVPPGVAGRSTIVEVGVTGDDGPTPARVPGGLRTAVAHAPLTTPPATRRPADVTFPKSLHHEAPAQAPLPGPRGRSHQLRSASATVLRVPATATGRPREFPERE